MVPHVLPILLPFPRLLSPLKGVCSSLCFSPSACLKKKFSSPATSEVVVVTSVGVLCTSYRILRRIISVTFNFNRQRKSAAVFSEPAICVIFKLNCRTLLHAFHKDGGITFVWKNRVIDLLSVRTIVRFVASDKLCTNSRSAM